MSLLPTIFHVIFSYIVIGLMRFATVDAASIVLFEDAQFKGINSTFQIGESTCVNLVGKLNDFYSSVDSMGVCFLLCEHANCRGKCEKVGGKLRDLSTIGLNDLVSSLSLCDDGDDATAAQDVDHPTGQPDTPSTTTSTRIFHRRSISTTTLSSRSRKRTKATRSTARKTRTRRSRKLTHTTTLPSLSPSTSTAKPIVHYLNHDVAWRTTDSESTTMSSSSHSSTIQNHKSNIIVNTTTNSQNNIKTANHLPVGVVHNSSRRDDDDGGGGRRRYRINVSSYDTHTSKEYDIAKSYPRRRIPSLSNHRRRRKQLMRQEQQQPIIIEKEQITSSS